VTAEPLPDGGVVSVLHDISEIEKSRKNAPRFYRQRFSRLRTPLTSIRGYAETLLDSEELNTANTREFLQIIRRNAERMARLTEDLLVLARVESGEEKLDLQPHAPGQLMQEAATALQENANAAEGRIDTRSAPWLSGDR